MATEERRNIAVLLSFLVIFIGQTALCQAKIFPELTEVKEWAAAIENDLVFMLDILTGYHVLNMTYNSEVFLANFSITFKEVNETALVENMATNLSAMLSKKMNGLWALVNAAEDAAKKYTYNPNLKKEDVVYFNAKDTMKALDSNLTYDPHFKQEVSFNYSSVHIPVEIYDGDISILNGLNWTAALDEQFRKNYEEDGEMLWQYFGSQTGFMRTYPASRWSVHESVDLYDVRRQSWYTQGSSSPKDMLILIDTSGSTHGQALQLMKNAVKSILDTLGENDFVNIVSFSQEAKFVSACLNHTSFVQANYRNKRQLEKDVDALEASGQADYQIGLRFAFEKFEEFQKNSTNNENSVGANCNKVIILLTDGGTDNAEDVFKEHNWPNKSVRVFTYAVGPTATPVAAIRWMACANRGYFSQIPAMGAIRARVQDYYEVLGRPLALGFVFNTEWTSSHKTPLTTDISEHTRFLKQGMEQLNVQPIQWEITLQPREYIPVLSRPQVLKNAKTFEWANVYKDHLGLGMMTTVTLPVYNRTLGSSNQTILGVMGIDVNTAELGKRTPILKIGPNGYSFAINPNGYAVFHPNLKKLSRFNEDPPNIDLLELEVEGQNPDLIYLRNEMIEGKKGEIRVTNTLFLSPNKQYVDRASATYSYTNITNTTFRLGLNVPIYQTHYPEFKETQCLTLSDFNPDNFTVALMIAPWDYFVQFTVNESLNENLASLVTILKSRSCRIDSEPLESRQLLQHLAWDLFNIITGEMHKYFAVIHQNLSDADNFTDKFNISEQMDDIQNFTVPEADIIRDTFNISEILQNQSFTSNVNFIATNGGLTMVYPSSEKDRFLLDLDVRNSTYYQRALYSDGYVLMPDFVAEFHSNITTPTQVTAVRSVAVHKFNYRTAVIGVRLDSTIIRDMMLKSIKKVNKSRDLVDCGNDSEAYCYLIDDGGFVIASSKPRDHLAETGRFLGEVDPQVWNFLQNKSMFGSVVQYDFQSKCNSTPATISSGRRTYFVPTLAMFYETLTVNWWTSKFAWAFVNFNIYNWLFGSSPVQGDDASDTSEQLMDNCVTAMQQYYFSKEITSASDAVECKNSTRLIRATQLKSNKTNLMLIVTEPRKIDAFDSECETLVKYGPRQITSEEEKVIVCSLSRNPRKRIQSYRCYDNDPNEDDSKCGSLTLVPSMMTLITAMVVMWFLKDDRR